MGRSDYDLPWYKYADIYRDCDKKALEGNKVSALQPMQIKRGITLVANITKIPILNGKNEAIGVLADASILPIDNETNRAILSLLSHDKKISMNHKDSTENYYLNDYNKSLKLTKREEECLFLLVRGKSTKIMGKFLSLSPRTVEIYINNIKQKLHVTSRNEIIDKAIELGLLEIIPKQIINNLLNSPKKWQQLLNAVS